MQYVEYRTRSRSSTARSSAATSSMAASPAMRLPTSCSGCRVHRLHPAGADVNPYADLLRRLRPGRLAADPHADAQLRPPLRSAAADARSQQSARQLRSRLSRAAASIVSDEAGLAMVPAFVRNSVPNTPFVTADRSRPAEDAAPHRQEQLNPRFGFAWRPFGDSRTVIRGGVGLYTVPLLGSVNYSMVATVTAAAVRSPTRRQLRSCFRTSPRRPRPSPRCRPARWTSAARIRSTCRIRARRSGALTFERDLGWSTGLRVSYTARRRTI